MTPHRSIACSMRRRASSGECDDDPFSASSALRIAVSSVRLALFEVQRHLFVGDTAPLRAARRSSRRARRRIMTMRDAERDDRSGTELERLERVGREQQGEQEAADDEGGAAHGELQAPAFPDVANDAGQLRSVRPSTPVRQACRSPCCSTSSGRPER